MPVFFVQGGGPTLLRQVVAAASVVLLALSSSRFFARDRQARSAFLYLYAVALALMALNMIAVLVQQAVGSPIGWVGRSALYAGDLFALAAVVSARSRAQSKRIPVERFIADFFEDAEENYRALVEDSNDGIVSFDGEGRILLWNRGAEKIFGYDRTEAVGASLFTLVFSQEYADQFRNDLDYFAGKHEVPPPAAIRETWATRKSGTMVPVDYSLSLRQSRYGWTGTCIFRDITETKRMEAIRVNEEKLSTIFENMVEEIHFWKLVRDEEGRIVTWRLVDANPPALKTWNRTLSGIRGLTTDEIFGAGSTDHYMPVVREVMSTGVALTYEDYFPQLDRHFRFTTIPLGDHFITTGADITSRKKAEEELRLNHAIIRNMEESVCVVKAGEGRILYGNPRFEAMFGYQAGELEGRHVSVVNAPSDRNPDETAREIMDRLDEGGAWQGDIENIRKDGTRFWTRATVSAFDHPVYGKVWISVSQDITARKKVEQALMESEEKYRSVFSAESDALFLVDRNTGAILEVNDAACRLYGYTREELLQMRNIDTSAEPEETERATQGAIARIPHRLHRKKDGTVFPVDISVSRFVLDGRDVILGAARDITEIRRTEEELKRHRDHLEELVKERTNELEKTSRSVDELNGALRVLLHQVQSEKEELEQRLVSNVEKLVLPYVERIGKSRLEERDRSYLEIMETNLHEIISPFLRNVQQLNLTPREVQVANLIKDGKTTKEIATVIGVATKRGRNLQEQYQDEAGSQQEKSQSPGIPAISEVIGRRGGISARLKRHGVRYRRISMVFRILPVCFHHGLSVLVQRRSTRNPTYNIFGECRR